MITNKNSEQIRFVSRLEKDIERSGGSQKSLPPLENTAAVVVARRRGSSRAREGREDETAVAGAGWSWSGIAACAAAAFAAATLSLVLGTGSPNPRSSRCACLHRRCKRAAAEQLICAAAAQ